MFHFALSSPNGDVLSFLILDIIIVLLSVLAPREAVFSSDGIPRESGRCNLGKERRDKDTTRQTNSTNITRLPKGFRLATKGEWIVFLWIQIDVC